MLKRMPVVGSFIVLAIGSMLCADDARAQATSPSVFVANNGNIEGSVTSFTLDENGIATFVQKIVTGSGNNHPGNNCQAISISPNGRWLVTGHGTISSTIEQLTFYEVHADSTMSILFTTTTPDSPVDVGWIDDDYLAVTATPSGNDFVIVYHFNPTTLSITQHFYQSVSYIFDFVIDHEHSLMYVRDGTSGVTVFRINPDRTLTRLLPSPVASGVYFLGPGVSPDGTKLYYGGGISSWGGFGSRWIGGFNIDTNTGALTSMPSSPYLSPPSGGTASPSPKQVVISSDNKFAYASHGGTAHIQGFSINQATGELTPIDGSFFDVGGQGDAGNMIVMDDKLFVTRRYAGTGGNPPAGLISLTIKQDGMLKPNGSTYPTTGSLPWDIAVWPGPVTPCPGDLSGDNSVGVADLLSVVNSWGPCPGECPPSCPADLNEDCTVGVPDLFTIINGWGPCQ